MIAVTRCIAAVAAWLVLLTILLGVAGGCSQPNALAYDDYFHDADMAMEAASAEREPSSPEASLFKSDQAVLSNEDIARIFSTSIHLRADAKLAAIQFARRHRWHWWSEEFSKLEEEATNQLLNKLRASPRLRSADVIPSMLVPQQMTVPYLREAAARLQADLLLVYRTYSQSYEKYRWFKQPETKARCTVEAVLLDTRSGIVVKTAIATQDFAATRGKDDANFYETIARAEQQAIGGALGKVADELVAYLDSAPGPRPATMQAADSK